MPWTAANHRTTKQIDFQYGGMVGATGGTGAVATFGDVYAYEQITPSKSSTFRSEAIPTAERDSLQVCADLPWGASGATASIEVQGDTWSGNVLSFSWALIGGNGDYVSAEIELWGATSS